MCLLKKAIGNHYATTYCICRHIENRFILKQEHNKYETWNPNLRSLLPKIDKNRKKKIDISKSRTAAAMSVWFDLNEISLFFYTILDIILPSNCLNL